MSIDDLIEYARDVPPEMVAVLGSVAGLLLVLAIGAQVSAYQLRRALHRAEEELVDRDTGLLPRSALRVRLGAELAWAATSGTPVAVAVMRIRGSRFVHGARVLRHAMREEESAFLLGDQRVATELWGADPDAAAGATRRLGVDLARAGHPVVDAGLACAPRDGSDVETLVAAAQRDLRPIDDPRPPGADLDRYGETRGPLAHVIALALGILPWFAAMGLLLLVTWRLVPAALEPIADNAGRSTAELMYSLVAVIGLPVGAALLHATCWNLGGGPAPSSHPIEPAARNTSSAIAVLIGAPLAWGVFGPSLLGTTMGFIASLAVLGLVVLAMLHARQLVNMPSLALAPFAALGGAVTWAAVEVSEHPLVADAGRMLFAAALGALLARQVERASWIAGLAVLAGVCDAWSVLAEGGITNQLLNGDEDSSRIVTLLSFTGPSVDGQPLFAIGVTDLVFLALFLAWSHDWRLDVRIVAVVLGASMWLASGTSEYIDDAVPMLPFLAGAMVLIVAVRSVRLRTRAARWKTAQVGSGS